MKNYSFYILISAVFLSAVFASSLHAQNEVPIVQVPAQITPVTQESNPSQPEESAPHPPVEPIDCAKTFEGSNVCPQTQCVYGCFKPTEDGGCEMTCVDKLCWDIKAQDCPPNRCQVLISCENKEICYPKQIQDFGSCGAMGYVGQDVPCCKGYIKRCGIEFFDGTCDMYGRRSVYSVPTCIPCGNGICDQFEQSCNCPEDCHRYGP